MSGPATRPVAHLDDVFPRDRLVILAGSPYRAGELTLGQRATLQAWIRDAAGHPLDGLPAFREDPDPPTRRARLLDAWHRAKAWPPPLGSGQDAALLATTEGRAVFLLVCLADRNEGFDGEAARTLATAMGPGDWARLRRVAHAVPPWRELAAELDPAWLERQAVMAEDPDPTDWGALVASVMRRGGYTFAELESWTPTQLRLYCAEGRVDRYEAATRAGESKEDFEARMIATFRVDAAPGMPGDGGPPGPPPPPGPAAPGPPPTRP